MITLSAAILNISIHSLRDEQSSFPFVLTISSFEYWSTRPLHSPQPVVIIVLVQVLVRMSVPTFRNIAKQTSLENNVGTVGLADGIIDDTCLVVIVVVIEIIIWLISFLTMTKAGYMNLKNNLWSTQPYLI